MDSNDLVKMIKKAAVEAVAAGKPANITYGKVISVQPLKVRLDQKLTLSAAQIVVPEHLTDHDVKIGDDIVRVYGGLKVNDMVILLQAAGGQRFIILDRIGG